MRVWSNGLWVVNAVARGVEGSAVWQISHLAATLVNQSNMTSKQR